jgi:hypothetical protein
VVSRAAGNQAAVANLAVNPAGAVGKPGHRVVAAVVAAILFRSFLLCSK